MLNINRKTETVISVILFHVIPIEVKHNTVLSPTPPMCEANYTMYYN
jgi:hypothetical protein